MAGAVVPHSGGQLEALDVQLLLLWAGEPGLACPHVSLWGVTVSPQVQAGLGAQSSTAPGSLLGFSSSPHLPCSEGVVSVLRAPAGLHPWMEQSLPVLCCWNRAVKHPDRILLPLPPCPSGWVTSVPQRSLAGWAQDL